MSAAKSEHLKIDNDPSNDHGPLSSDSGDAGPTGSLDSDREEDMKRSEADLEYMLTDELLSDLASRTDGPPPGSAVPGQVQADLPRPSVLRRNRPDSGSATERLRQRRQAVEDRRANHRSEAVRARRTLSIPKLIERARRPQA